MNTPEPQLQVSGVSKSYGGLHAVQDVSFAVERGTITSLIGPNGAGKTTLFGVIAGEAKPDRGSVFFEARLITGLAPHAICAIGIARTFQNPRVFPELTCLENVLAARYVRTGSSVVESLLGIGRATREGRADLRLARELINFVGLSSQESAWPLELSYGNMRRLEIARALATEPTLLLMDEPTAGMAAHVISDLIAFLQRLTSEGLTILLVEHNMEVVSTISQKIVAMDHGVKIAEGSADTVLRSPAVVEAYLGVA